MKPLLLCLTLIALTACSTTLDPRSLDTDEGVVTAYNRLNDGQDIVEDDLCIDRPRQLNDVVLVGFFAYDAGCQYSNAFVNGAYGTIEDMTPAGLTHNGWDNEPTRPDLALTWTQDILLVEYHPLNNPNDDFERTDTPTFTKPSTTPTDSGGVIIELWAEDPAGMFPETTYRLRHYEFDAQANLINSQTLQSFTIEFD